MAFQKAALLSAVIASASLARAAPLTTRQMFPSSCTLHPKSWGSITLDGFPLSVSDSGTVVVGGNPQQFAYAVCPSENYGDRNLVSETQGYIVDAYDNTQCLTASTSTSLAPLSLSKTADSTEPVTSGLPSPSPGRSTTTEHSQNANLYFNGENPNYVNETSYPLYTLKTQYAKPTFEGTPWQPYRRLHAQPHLFASRPAGPSAAAEARTATSRTCFPYVQRVHRGFAHLQQPKLCHEQVRWTFELQVRS